jgi:hypothetical protein
MSFLNEATPTVTVKKKNLSSLIEYCIENRIDFTLRSRTAKDDEFDVEFLISNTQKAISLGMCLKELRLELNGVQVVPVSAIRAKKQASLKESNPGNGQGIIAEGEVTMAFEDALQFELGATN